MFFWGAGLVKREFIDFCGAGLRYILITNVEAEYLPWNPGCCSPNRPVHRIFNDAVEAPPEFHINAGIGSPITVDVKVGLAPTLGLLGVTCFVQKSRVDPTDRGVLITETIEIDCIVCVIGESNVITSRTKKLDFGLVQYNFAQPELGDYADQLVSHIADGVAEEIAGPAAQAPH